MTSVHSMSGSGAATARTGYAVLADPGRAAHDPFKRLSLAGGRPQRHKGLAFRLDGRVTNAILIGNSNYFISNHPMKSHPLPARHRFGLQFSVLARQWRRVLEKSLESAGLSDATWAPLIHLQESGGGITQKDLAGLVGIDGSTLVRLLDILSDKGFIERRVDESDRRANLIFLTDAGREAVIEIRQVLSAAEADMLADISDAELDTMIGVFDRIGKRLRDLQGQKGE